MINNLSKNPIFEIRMKELIWENGIETYNIYEMNRQSRFDAWYWMLGAGALGRPRGMVQGGRWEGDSGWGTHVYPWLIHVNVWQKSPQYCKVISLQLKLINKKNFFNHVIWIRKWTPSQTQGKLLFFYPGWKSISSITVIILVKADCVNKQMTFPLPKKLV